MAMNALAPQGAASLHHHSGLHRPEPLCHSQTEPASFGSHHHHSMHNSSRYNQYPHMLGSQSDYFAPPSRQQRAPGSFQQQDYILTSASVDSGSSSGHGGGYGAGGFGGKHQFAPALAHCPPQLIPAFAAGCDRSASSGHSSFYPSFADQHESHYSGRKPSATAGISSSSSGKRCSSGAPAVSVTPSALPPFPFMLEPNSHFRVTGGVGGLTSAVERALAETGVDSELKSECAKWKAVKCCAGQICEFAVTLYSAAAAVKSSTAASAGTGAAADVAPTGTSPSPPPNSGSGGGGKEYIVECHLQRGCRLLFAHVYRAVVQAARSAFPAPQAVQTSAPCPPPTPPHPGFQQQHSTVPACLAPPSLSPPTDRGATAATACVFGYGSASGIRPVVSAAAQQQLQQKMNGDDSPLLALLTAPNADARAEGAKFAAHLT
jgi:hypothetical protein